MKLISIKRFRTPQVKSTNLVDLLGTPEVTFIIKEREGVRLYIKVDKRKDLNEVGSIRYFDDETHFNNELNKAKSEFFQIDA